VTWALPAQQLVVDRRGPPLLLSLLLSVTVPRPVSLGKITLLNIHERHRHASHGHHGGQQVSAPASRSTGGIAEGLSARSPERRGDLHEPVKHGKKVALTASWDHHGRDRQHHYGDDQEHQRQQPHRGDDHR
jgi:hypothetical protein